MTARRIVLAALSAALFEGCINNGSPQESRGISPGLYHAYLEFPDPGDNDNIYTRVSATGVVEHRQYGTDSVVWYHSRGRLKFTGDSVFFTDWQAREYESGADPQQGTWTEWRSREPYSRLTSSLFPEIQNSYYVTDNGEKRIRFDKVGDANASWPPAKNAVTVD